MFGFDLQLSNPMLYQSLKRWLWLPWLGIILSVLGIGAQITAWAIDTKPPFALLSYTATPTPPGGILRIDGKVRRDVHRGCSLTGSRYIIDSKGARYDIGGGGMMTAEALRLMDAAAPGELHQVYQIPTYIAPGKASMVSTMHYFCNPLHQLMRPIAVEMVIEFEVLG